jgi:glucose dehydrogenase
MRFTVDSVYAARGGRDPFTHAYFRKLPDSLQYGVLSAVDVNTGHIRWQRRIGRHLMYGGALATESGLVFLGDSQGWLNALDAETGETLWRGRAGQGALGPPISYVVDGRQRIAVTSQRGLTVFGLPEPRSP